jgi:hypothetical protein
MTQRIGNGHKYNATKTESIVKTARDDVYKDRRPVDAARQRLEAGRKSEEKETGRELKKNSPITNIGRERGKLKG